MGLRQLSFCGSVKFRERCPDIMNLFLDLGRRHTTSLGQLGLFIKYVLLIVQLFIISSTI